MRSAKIKFMFCDLLDKTPESIISVPIIANDGTYKWKEYEGVRFGSPIFSIYGQPEDVAKTIQKLRDSNDDEKFTHCTFKSLDCDISAYNDTVTYYFSLYLTNEARKNIGPLRSLEKLVLDNIIRLKRSLAVELLYNGFLNHLSPAVVKNIMTDKLFIEGKTKIIKPYEHNKFKVVVKTKDSLSGGDGAKKENIKDIGKHKTKQTCNVFTLLKRKGIETSFIKQLSSNEMLCYDCEMLPVEWVVRRYAWGSYPKMHPWLKQKPQPHKLTEPLTAELFHKHTVVAPPARYVPTLISEDRARERYLKDGKWADGVHTDPLINISNEKWGLFPRLKSVLEAKELMNITPIISTETVKKITDTLIIPTFEILEEAWANIKTVEGPVVLVDIKLEVGKRKDTGQYVIADVIDNDNWRIWPGGDPTKQLDKQCFREDYPLDDVSKNYEIVTKLTDKFLL